MRTWCRVDRKRIWAFAAVPGALLLGLSQSVPAADGSMVFNTIWKQDVQACGGCGLWFDWQDKAANKPKLVVEYVAGGKTQTKTYQHGLNGQNDNGHATFIDDRTSASIREDRKHGMLIKLSPRRRGLLKFDISDIPASATIAKATLHLHIHTQEGLANGDNSSVLSVYRCPRDWNWDEATDTYYDKGQRWSANGGDFGQKIVELRAKEDMKDRGFRKSNPDIWFDFTDYVKALQKERGGAPSNQPPAAQNDAAITQENSAVTIKVLDNDSDPNGDTLSINKITPPSGGTVSDNGDGTLTYTPNAGFSGQDVFSYTVTDGNGGTATATVIITVNAQPDTMPPVATLTVLAIGGQVDDPSVREVSIAGSRFVVAGGTFSGESILLGNPVAIQVSASDLAGNTVTRVLDVTP